ncbi:MAG: acyltransferase [Patescibacteria group bacterium]
MRENEGYFADPTAIIDDGAIIGAGTKIWHFSHVMSGAQIGQNCSLGQNVYVGGQAVIGNNAKIQNNVSVYDKVVIDDYVFCGPSMVFTNDWNPRAEFPKHGNYKKTVIRRGATIGANVTIVCGITIGKYAFIGAGSVVTKDVPDFALWYGNPARHHGWVSDHATRLEFDGNTARCSVCNQQYIEKNNSISQVT